MKTEVIMANDIGELNRIIAERKPDRVESVSAHSMHDLCGDPSRVLNQWTEYTAVLYWDDFCEWTHVGDHCYTISCIEEKGYSTEPRATCHICGKPVRIRLEPKP